MDQIFIFKIKIQHSHIESLTTIKRYLKKRPQDINEIHYNEILTIINRLDEFFHRVDEYYTPRVMETLLLEGIDEDY